VSYCLPMKALHLCPAMLAASLAMLGCSALEARSTQETATLGRASQPLKDAQASERTDVVAVLTNVQGTQSWCTGIVIESGLVLTAEHCLGPASAPELAIDCATATLPEVSSTSEAWVIEGENARAADSSQIHSVRNAKVPADATRLCGQDIALLELAVPLTAATTAVITADTVAPGSEFLAVGYGTDGATSAVQRQNAAARLVCVGTQCNDARIAPGELLASSNACEGDSGSPAIDQQGRSFAMAVRSNSDCSQTAYLQMAPCFTWLANNVAATASAQGRDVPSWAAVVQSPSDSGIQQEDTDAALPSPAASPIVEVAGGGGCAIYQGKSNPNPMRQLLVVLACLVMVKRRRISR
jgi:hypothetical protein